MALVLVTGGRVAMLQSSISYLNGLEYRLFVNDTTPDEFMDIEDLTFCADGDCATPRFPTFPTPTLNGDDKAETTAPALTWTFTHDAGDFTVHGYGAVDVDTDTLVYAERAPTPFVCTAPGQTYSITPRYTRTAE